MTSTSFETLRWIVVPSPASAAAAGFASAFASASA
eukprot:CAMPEP_0205924734 /NCGR_PEP_ID=MMETSP1325-20131115/17149_1 /ASSEMBLY_ACC=CAM_ASM_000708 /TAXON_ID=236786 /ORGANISM="Florenciella sp., Strain RCC1007" /LENGTH=34 /DNA_ID= /DNA_START= /DNA_END= /DNA_ORIENTATION=